MRGASGPSRNAERRAKVNPKAPLARGENTCDSGLPRGPGAARSPHRHVTRPRRGGLADCLQLRAPLSCPVTPLPYPASPFSARHHLTRVHPDDKPRPGGLSWTAGSSVSPRPRARPGLSGLIKGYGDAASHSHSFVPYLLASTRGPASRSI